MTSVEIPGQGTRVSQPIFVQGHWYNYLRSLPIWALIVFLLVVPKENRNRQAWLILIPLVLLPGILCLPAISRLMDPLTAEMVGFLIGTGVLAWSIVWLMGHWLGSDSRTRTFCLVLGVMLAIGLLSCLCQFEGAGDLAFLLIPYGLSVAILLLAMMQTGYLNRKTFTPQRFLGRLLLWIAIFVIGLALFALILIMIFVHPELKDAGIAVLGLGAASIFWGGILFILNLPFLLLAFNSSFYRERLKQIFINSNSRLEEDQWNRHLDDTPLSTEPTGRSVRADDLVGRWRFYLDSALRTVSIDFRPDGTFAQTISPNEGGMQQCPGGTWRLEGPKVHLEGYITAAQGTSQQRTWWMIDTPSGSLALFGGDGPDAQSFFCIPRRQPWLE